MCLYPYDEHEHTKEESYIEERRHVWCKKVTSVHSSASNQAFIPCTKAFLEWIKCVKKVQKRSERGLKKDGHILRKGIYSSFLNLINETDEREKSLWQSTYVCMTCIIVLHYQHSVPMYIFFKLSRKYILYVHFLLYRAMNNEESCCNAGQMERFLQHICGKFCHHFMSLDVRRHYVQKQQNYAYEGENNAFLAGILCTFLRDGYFSSSIHITSTFNKTIG